MKDNEAFAARIAEFVRSIERGGNSRENISSMMSELEQFAPHSQLSGIIFYGERERIPKEIADEALLRERVWKKGGVTAVTARVESLMRAALTNPATDATHRYAAMNVLDGIERDRGRRRPS